MFITSKSERGFTLIELLVVIAIIGILSSVVLASLNSARLKSRDAKRISDIKQLQLAFELHFDDNASYPTAIDDANLVTPGYISTIPADPLGGAYAYAQLTSGTSYHVGASLEDPSSGISADGTNGGHTVLRSDLDKTTGTTVLGSDNTGCTGEADRGCYDVGP